MNNLSSPISLIKKSFGIFFKRENFIYFLKIQAPLLPLAFIAFVWAFILAFWAASLGESLATNPFFVFLIPVIGVLNAIVGLVVGVASIDAVRRVLTGAPMSVREAYLVAKERIWKFLFVNFVRGMIVLGGFILLIIPGIVFSVWFVFSGFEAVVGGSGVKESLAKSKALVKGRFWKVLGRLIVFGIFTGVVGIALTSVPLGIGNFALPIFGILFLLPTYLLFTELGGRGQESVPV